MDLVAVTGATGKVGGALVAELRSSGTPVRAGVRASSDTSGLPDDVERSELDLDRPETLRPFLDSAQRLFLVTPLGRDMVEQVRTVAAALPASGVQHVVRLSTRDADPDSSVTLPRWHGEAEDALTATSVGTTMLRPNSFMQNYLMVAPAIRAGGVFRRNEGDASVSLVDVRDVAAVAARALTEEGHEGQVYDLTGAEALSNDDVATIVSDVSGSSVRYEAVPDAAARDEMIHAGMPEWLADVMVEVHVHHRAGGADEVTPVVEEVTGRAPRSFRSFVEERQADFTPDDG